MALPTYDEAVTEVIERTLYLAPADQGVAHSDANDRNGRIRRLGEHLMQPLPADGFWSWLGPLIVTIIGGALRFYHLAIPKTITLDETYYVKGGLSLWKYGYERDAIDKADQLLSQGKTDIFASTADYVVHPMFGKWVIGAGIHIFGPNAFGWRFMVALLGTLAVFVTARIGRRLFRSTLLGCIAGLLLATDGTAIVMSRIGMLDGILAALLIFAFGCLLLDRDRSRALLAKRMKFIELDPAGHWSGPGPHLGWRGWRLASGVFLGLALGTKWSALYFIAFFVIVSLLWDAGARRAAGIATPVRSTMKRDVVPTLLSLVALSVVIYLATWTGWLVTGGGWDRQWGAQNPSSIPFVPDALRSLWHYHVAMYKFHSTLTTSHPYQSNAWGWLIQARPTAIYYSSSVSCAAAKCTSAITSLGNPMLWWAGVLALPYLAFEWLGRRDWRAGVILGCVAAGWLPWVILYNSRTVFAFYTVALSGFIALAVTYCLGRILGPASASIRRRMIGAGVVGAYVAVVLVCASFFLPIWNGDPISYAQWAQRMWFQSWI